MYDAYDYYSRATARYLWSLNQLDELKDVSRNLRRAAREGLSLADTAAEAHSMERVPMKISSAADATPPLTPVTPLQRKGTSPKSSTSREKKSPYAEARTR